MGKFLAATGFLAVIWSSSLVYAVSLDLAGGPPDWPAVLGTWFGTILVSGLFVSIGMLAATSTSTPLLAAFLSMVASLMWMAIPFLAARLMDYLVPLLTSSAEEQAALVERMAGVVASMDALRHFSRSFQMGILDSAEVIFFLTWTGFFLFLTARSIEARRVARMSGSGGNVGWLSRFGIGAQVLLTAALALMALLLVNWLAARPGIRQRVDMTASGSNTLSTASLGVLERLESDIQIDILYRPMNAPLTALGQEVLVRTDKLLLLMEEAAAGRVAIQAVDTSDQEAPGRSGSRSCGLRGYENGLVISNGDRREFLALSGDLAVFDIGNPVPESFIPPRIQQFGAERAIIGAILDVTKGAERHVYFTFGFGELDALESADNAGLGLLAEELERDGLRVHRWNFLDDGPLPEDCDAVAVVGPQVGWPEDMYAEVVEYVEAGGRLLVAPETVPELLRKSDVPDLLGHFGLEVSEGRVMRPLLDRRTGLVVQGQQGVRGPGRNRGPDEPAPDARRDARGGGVVLRADLPPDQGRGPAAGRGRADALPLLPRVLAGRAPVRSSLRRGARRHVPLPLPRGPRSSGRRWWSRSRRWASRWCPRFASWRLAPRRCSRTRRCRTPGSAPLTSCARPSTGLLDREHRITVPQRDPEFRFLPLDRPRSVVWVMRVAQYLLPLAALLAGVLVWLAPRERQPPGDHQDFRPRGGREMNRLTTLMLLVCVLALGTVAYLQTEREAKTIPADGLSEALFPGVDRSRIAAIRLEDIKGVEPHALRAGTWRGSGSSPTPSPGPRSRTRCWRSCRSSCGTGWWRSPMRWPRRPARAPSSPPRASSRWRRRWRAPSPGAPGWSWARWTSMARGSTCGGTTRSFGPSGTSRPRSPLA